MLSIQKFVLLFVSLNIFYANQKPVINESGWLQVSQWSNIEMETWTRIECGVPGVSAQRLPPKTIIIIQSAASFFLFSTVFAFRYNEKPGQPVWKVIGLNSSSRRVTMCISFIHVFWDQFFNRISYTILKMKNAIIERDVFHYEKRST